jgi:hypothetical protein
MIPIRLAAAFDFQGAADSGGLLDAPLAADVETWEMMTAGVSRNQP